MFDGVNRVRLLAAGALVLLLAGGVAASQVGRESSADRAAAILGDGTRFGTASAAGQAFIQVSQLLRTEAESCGDESKQRCRAYFSASGFAQITAVNVLQCTAPGIFDARTALREHVDRLRSGDEDAALPAVPRC